ncbi:MAG TPA: hypothetical protein VNR42_05200 [Solirubrobacteraceae bacterium]|nr:hypothetical protein [Solirubrobacteraceae bacterium]
MRVHGNRLYAGSRPWRAWGMNWGVGDDAPVVSFFDNPTAANFSVLKRELRTAHGMGANSMRVYLQLGQVMATATRSRQATLTALRDLLTVAQDDGIYLDITGDLVWQPSRAPTWYERMPWQERWQVQARFWKAVAHAASTSPAVLCYELTSEPIVAQNRGPATTSGKLATGGSCRASPAIRLQTLTRLPEHGPACWQMRSPREMTAPSASDYYRAPRARSRRPMSPACSTF